MQINTPPPPKWYSIGKHNYEILLATTRNYTVLVLGTNIGGRTSDLINGSISVIYIVPVQTGKKIYFSRNMHLIFSYLRLLGLVGFSDYKSIIYRARRRIVLNNVRVTYCSI